MHSLFSGSYWSWEVSVQFSCSAYVDASRLLWFGILVIIRAASCWNQTYVCVRSCVCVCACVCVCVCDCVYLRLFMHVNVLGASHDGKKTIMEALARSSRAFWVHLNLDLATSML